MFISVEFYDCLQQRERMNLLLVLFMVGSTTAQLDEIGDSIPTFLTSQFTKDDKTTSISGKEFLGVPQYVSDHAVDNVSTRRSGLGIDLCFWCRIVTALFFDGVEIGLSDEVLSNTLTLFCTLLGVGTYGVCKGVVELNVPILIHIIKTTPEAKPATFCGLALQVAKADVCPFADPRFEWQVDLPEPVVAKKRPISRHERKPLTAVLITDAHVDPLYKPTADANCDKPACCRAGETEASSNFFHFNESAYANSFNNVTLLYLRMAEEIRKTRESYKKVDPAKATPAGYWGDYGYCGTPPWAFDDVIDRIAKAHKNIDVVYYIGDTIDHHIWETTYEQNQRMNSYLVDKIRRTFGEHVLFVPVVGNHESQPVNQFAPASVKGVRLNTTWLYKSLAKKWEFYLPKKARATFLKRGEYSVLVRPGLRAIALNNNVANKYNWWQVYNPCTPKEHLDWLVKELHKAELAGEKVHILTHIPPGEADLAYTWTREYNRIINRFASTIAAEFNGHTHSDEFRIFFNTSGDAVHVAWNVGGITSYFDFNPNYKVAKFHPVTFEPTEIENYIYNLTNANLTPKRKPQWYKLYNFKKKFQLPNLSPSSIHDLVTKMAADKELLDLYSYYYYKMSDAIPPCDADCKFEELCRTVVTVLWDRQKCDDLKKSLLKTLNEPLRVLS